MSETQDILIRELKGFKEISAIFPLINQVNPEVSEADFTQRLKSMLKQGYRCAGVFDHDSGRLVGCMGFWAGTRFWCGDYIEPDNLVIDRNYRGNGVGRKFMGWLEAEGRRTHCNILKLEAYLANKKARAFYQRMAYEEMGIVITKPIALDPEVWQKTLAGKAH